MIQDDKKRAAARAALEFVVPGELNQLAGAVTNGLFARRGADVVLVGTGEGVERF